MTTASVGAWFQPSAQGGPFTHERASRPGPDASDVANFAAVSDATHRHLWRSAEIQEGWALLRSFDVEGLPTATSPADPMVCGSVGVSVMSVWAAFVGPAATAGITSRRGSIGRSGSRGSLGDNHSMKVYESGAAAVDQSDDPALRATLEELRADGYLGSGAKSSTQTYTITREQ